MIEPIDDLIEPLLHDRPLTATDKLKLYEALKRLSDVALTSKTVTAPHLADNSVLARTIADGAVVAAALADGAKNWITDVVFSATDHDTVEWTAASLTFADGTTHAISAGNTGTMSALTYIYFDSDTSLTILQTSTTYSDVVGDNKRLMCIAQNTADSNQEAFYVPAVGVFGINETVIGPASISTAKIQALAITVDEIAANTITAAKMNVAQLSAIAADIGTITAGSLDAVTITAGTITGTTIKTAASGRRIEIDSTNGIRSYNSSGVLKAQLDDDDLALLNIGPVNVGDNMLFGDTAAGVSPTGTRRLITGRSAASAQTYIEVAEKTSGQTDAIRGVCANVQRFSVDGNGDWTIDFGDFTLASGTFNGDGSGLTSLNASELDSGTVPDARFPATLPAASGVNLTALNASNLGSGTVPDARFPATLPAASGVNLTALNASNLGSGTVPDARLPSEVPLDDEANTFTADQTFDEDCDVRTGKLKIPLYSQAAAPTLEAGEIVFWWETGVTAHLLLNDGTNTHDFQRDGFF